MIFITYTYTYQGHSQLLKSISLSPHYEINRPPNLLEKRKKREVMFFRAVHVSRSL